MYNINMCPRKHYTYELYDPINDMKYIGVRTAPAGVEPKDDTYMGSVQSKQWISEWGKIKRRCTKKIDNVFETRQEAEKREIYLHEKYEVAASKKYYNACKAASTKFNVAGIPKTDEQKKKISESNKGKHFGATTKEWRQNISAGNKGKRRTVEHRENYSKARQKLIAEGWKAEFTQETRKKLSAAARGKTKSNEHREKLRQSNVGQKRKLVICPHCGKAGGNGIMPRWHFDNCKHKQDQNDNN